MGMVYRKAATDPTKLAYVMREDVALKIADDHEHVKECVCTSCIKEW